ncbi:uncharacterized protein VICG_01230 [Vittaforma corneae ATCC 50505]|uniref:DNA-directed RNA polymerases I and III subunit RPAC1 n=1 Tax=Vittaforma corneae (strain ATCC 50505) TaxID=993615 RepID=L2GLK3_VITCO|nr:uncharacterized protein VICG_01230 [Vittaforma corneae ATCC 50505]ELA41726.1 hypothetical protein VICG_01230 [Vittaforma corneae ATCC 50505]
MYRVEAEATVKDFEISNASLDEFINNLQLKIISKTASSIEFDILNCHPSIANTLRRILISKVPTMAIHYVSVYENNTVFPDEYIAHRLGLIPLEANPEYFSYFKDEETFENVLNFRIDKTADKEPVNLMSDDIEFVPAEGQDHFSFRFKPNVLVCKMVPGNQVEMTFKAIKGRGEQHAKWSPVSLCSYRIMPKIILEKDFYGEDAKELQACFSPGVIEIINNKAVVANPRLESMSREALRHEKFKDSVKILRESGWFCFNVETITLDPIQVLKMGLEELIRSCKELKEEVRLEGESYG